MSELLVAEGVKKYFPVTAGIFFKKEVGAASDMGADWPGGYYCPCHNSRFDLAARVFKGSPAPTNLTIPPHRYADAAGAVRRRAARPRGARGERSVVRHLSGRKSLHSAAGRSRGSSVPLILGVNNHGFIPHGARRHGRLPHFLDLKAQRGDRRPQNEARRMLASKSRTRFP